MRRFTFELNGSSTTINFPRSFRVDTGSRLFISKITVFWDYANINDDDVLYVDDGSPQTYERGFYTLSDIEEDLLKKNIEMKVFLHSNKVTLSSKRKTGKNLVLRLYGELLGIQSGTVVEPDDDALSNTVIGYSDLNILRGLRYFTIHCSIVNEEFNLINGKRSQVIATLPVPQHKRLNGTVETHHELNNKVMLDGGTTSQMTFDIRDPSGNNVDVGKILVECYVN